jgi:methylated-DNA-[protein]-cysteine S-methyltransferase
MNEVVLEVSHHLRKFFEERRRGGIYFRVLLDPSGVYASTFEERFVEAKNEDRNEAINETVIEVTNEVTNEAARSKGSEMAERLKEDLIRYFSGESVDFEYPLSKNLKFTPFQLRVLTETKKIPYGKTISYGELAERIGTRGFRAVGQALKRNPLPVIVPCHRVLAKNSLGGYAGKINLKKALLRLEGAVSEHDNR